MRTLHLTLKKKWFDMIESGEKKEEYREIKPYWQDRLMQYDYVSRNNIIARREYTEFNQFDYVTFTNGYGKSRPSITLECLGISIGSGKEEWGSNGESFVIKLGEKIIF